MNKLKELQQKYGKLLDGATTAAEGGDMDKYNELKGQMDPLEAQISALKELQEKSKTADTRIGLPLGQDAPPETDDEIKAKELKSIHVLRYGDVDAAQEHILSEVYGDANYYELMGEQEDGFKSFIRSGGRQTTAPHLARRQLWAADDVIEMLKDGMSVAEIKATMVEGTDILGGYAVPPQRARQVLKEQQGLVAARRAGATVVRTASSQIEWLKVTGATSGSYPSGLRGAWGGETQSPTEKNFEIGLTRIPCHLYTYKVPVSVSLLEDATNILPVLNQLMAETMAVDEDTEFIVGTGEKAPRGVLPGGDTVETGVTTYPGGVSASFDVDEYKALRRSIASVYRAPGRACYVFNSTVANLIETFQDGEGRFYFTSVGQGEPTFGSRTFETEAMNDHGSSAYSCLYGDWRGYAIVERLGLAIVRFQDSATGINKVEFHLRRRIGGAVIEPYRFAVLQCAA